MKIEVFDSLSQEQLQEKAAAFPYAWIRCLSSVALGRNSGFPDPEEIIEARFFGPDSELRLYRNENRLCARCFTAEETDHCIREIHRIENNNTFGRSLTLCRVLAFDEDGQAYVCATRLCGWKGEM